MYCDPPAPARGTGSFQYKDITYDLIDNKGHYEIRRASACNPRHEMFITFSSALPDVSCLRDGIELQGQFGVGVDDAAGMVAGAYGGKRHGD